jgi:hypothetical protein
VTPGRRDGELPLVAAGGEPVDFARKLRIAGSSDRKLTKTVAHMFRLDENLSGFYALVREDELAWCALGAGRMLRAPTVFEDVTKTTCTPIRRRCDDLSGCRDAITSTNERKERHEASTGRVHGGVARGA